MPFIERRSGVLLHPSSLPGADSFGTLGDEAYRFVDFLNECGFGCWQVLPLGPTDSHHSPYNSISAFAGDPKLIDQHRVSPINENALTLFMASQSAWLPDYALFRALKERLSEAPWIDWPEPLRDRDPIALEQARKENEKFIRATIIQQFHFYQQWKALKNYASEKNIRIIGDVPIFVAHDSADAWSHRNIFKLDTQGQPKVVTGVPPDYFSATGQRWGNPHYDWNALEERDFDWWVSRLEHALDLFDWVRIDHFRGFEACWEIPAEEETAINGMWVPAPGMAFFHLLKNRIPHLPLIAEDLGLITDSVIALRDQFGFPGMRILQFAFDGNADNQYLPHNHTENSVVYTGTHDNATTLGWFHELEKPVQNHILNYYGWPGEPMPWPLVKSALASVAKLAIIPMQDLLALGNEHRMNTPGTATDNWRWRFSWHQVSDTLARDLASLNEMYGRTV